MKTEHKFQLTSYGNMLFVSRNSKIRVLTDLHDKPNVVRVTTAKGEYFLAKHPTMNLYTGKVGEYKAHFTHKVQVATLIVWY